MRFSILVLILGVFSGHACGDGSVAPSGEVNPRDMPAPSPAPGAILSIVASPEFDHTHGLDSVVATITGAETRSLELQLNNSRFQGRVDGLSTGTYAVVSMGFVAGEIAMLTSPASVMVSEGDSTDISIALLSFVPTLGSVGRESPSVSTIFEVNYAPVALATSYVVEMDTTPRFESASRHVTTDSSTMLPTNEPGTYIIRVRAQQELVGSGAPSEIRSVQIVTDQAVSGDNAATAPRIEVGTAGTVTYDRLNILPGGDEDWFAIDLSAGDSLTVVARSASLIPRSTLIPELALHSQANNVLAEANRTYSQAADARLTASAAADGTHFIRVSGADGQSVGHYELDVSVERSDSDTVQPNLVEETYTSVVSTTRDRRRLVINGQYEWQTFWQEFQGFIAPEPDAPEIDFADHMVIAASMGEQTTGGHSVVIDSVIERDGELTVYVVEASPAPNCSVVQVVTAPATAVVVPFRDLPVKFTERTVVRECC
jgi:hypothetical protein